MNAEDCLLQNNSTPGDGGAICVTDVFECAPIFQETDVDGGESSVPRFSMRAEPNVLRDGRTTLRYALPEVLHVDLAIYDVSGRRVRTLVHENRAAGSHVIGWNARNDHGQFLSSGVYFYRIDAGGRSQAGRLVLLK